MESEKWRKEKGGGGGWAGINMPTEIFQRLCQRTTSKKKTGSVQMLFTCGPTSLERPTGERDVEEEG